MAKLIEEAQDLHLSTIFHLSVHTSFIPSEHTQQHVSLNDKSQFIINKIHNLSLSPIRLNGCYDNTASSSAVYCTHYSTIALAVSDTFLVWTQIRPNTLSYQNIIFHLATRPIHGVHILLTTYPPKS